MHNYDAQQHRAGQIISPLTLQTITIAQMLSVGGEGARDGGPVMLCLVRATPCYSTEVAKNFIFQKIYFHTTMLHFQSSMPVNDNNIAHRPKEDHTKELKDM